MRSTFGVRPSALLAALAGACASGGAMGSCGASFCMINTDWGVQGLWTEQGWRADLRYELVDQSRLMRGSSNYSPSLPTVLAEGVERKTRTQRLTATADIGITSRLGVSVAVPFLDRQHAHIEARAPDDVTWRFRQLGDARLLARYNLSAEPASTGSASLWGVIAGTKLPTGPIDIRNTTETRAERSLQPGTGSTDLILGGYAHGALPWQGGTWFAQLLVEHAVATRDGFRPGDKSSLDVGGRWQWSEDLSPMLQINLQSRRPDTGSNAEPALSGSRAISLSPGLAVRLGSATRAYGFLQLPLYQHVSGVQLAPRWALALGVQTLF